MVVLDEGDYFTAWLHVVDVLDVVVDRCVLIALLGVIENFLDDRNVFEGKLASRVAIPLHVWKMKELFHLLEHLRQEDDVLSCILKHLNSEWSLCVPEGLVILHLLGDCFLLVVLYLLA